LLARPRPAAGPAQIRAELTVIAHRLDQQSPTRHTTLIVSPARLFDLPQARTAAVGVSAMLLVAVALILVVACANVANMLLARSAARQREIAVRRALGASRLRLIRQLLTETVLLACAGGIAGVVLAAWSSAALLHFVISALPPQISRTAITANWDWRVLEYACGATALAALACGVLPAWRASDTALSGDLKRESGAPLAQGRTIGWWRHLLLSSQMLIAMTLLLAAGLFVRALYRTETIDPGFRTAGISVVKFDLNAAGYDDATASTVRAALLARVLRIPGVSVARAWVSPLGLDGLGGRFLLADGTPFLGNWNAVSSNYFDVLETPIVKGRGFTPDESEGAHVVVVTESTARRLWPGTEPLGQTLRRQRGPANMGDVDEVIGVVRDAQVAQLGTSDSTFVYFPASAQDQSASTLLVRRQGPASSLEGELRNAVREVDPSLVASVNSLGDNLRVWRGLSRLAAVGSGVLAGLALVLATIGVYGVVAYTVTRRTREIGIRVALGATNRNVVSMVLRQTLQPVVIGALGGTICSAAVSRLMSALLFGLSPHDPLSFATLPLLLLAVAALASYLPARRAAKVDPIVALRVE
jgi:predicted permease